MVFFDFNESSITKEAKTQLDSLLAKKESIIVNSIHGFCDSVDTNKYNDSLSVERAKSVANYLEIKNLKLDLKIKGFGERFIQDKEQAKNRKVEIYFSLKLSEKPKIEYSNNDKIIQAKIGDKIVLKNMNFHNLSDILLDDSKPVVSELIETMLKNPKLKIAIHGHICCQTEEGKYDVSEARAKRVYNILVKYGVSANRLSYKGFGSKLPIHKLPEKTETQRIENRRVEIVIVNK